MHDSSNYYENYFSDMWNVMDAANYVLFFMVYVQVIHVLRTRTRGVMSSLTKKTITCTPQRPIDTHLRRSWYSRRVRCAHPIAPACAHRFRRSSLASGRGIARATSVPRSATSMTGP